MAVLTFLNFIFQLVSLNFINYIYIFLYFSSILHNLLILNFVFPILSLFFSLCFLNSSLFNNEITFSVRVFHFFDTQTYRNQFFHFEKNLIILIAPQHTIDLSIGLLFKIDRNMPFVCCCLVSNNF